MNMDIEKEKNQNLCLETVTEMLKLRNSIEHTVAPITQRYGLTPMQTAALHFIDANSDSTVGAVFRALELNQGNASSMCKRLESDGFIIRRRSDKDERRVVLELTEMGRRVVNSIEQDSKSVIPCMQDIDPEEKRRVEESLNIIKDFAIKLRKTLTDNEEKNTNA